MRDQHDRLEVSAGRRSSMISFGCRCRRHLRVCCASDHVVVAGAMIVMCRRSYLGLIMLVGRRWFSERIADVLRDRLSGAVISAVPYPAGDFATDVRDGS